MIKDMLIAGVGIQMSWFLIMVIVDVSTVLFALVSSFPSQVIGSDAMFSNALSATTDQCPQTADNKPTPYGNVICKANKNLINFAVDPNDTAKKVRDSLSSLITVEPKAPGTEQSKENLFDNLLPRPDSLSWPLMFLGFEIFKTAQISDYYPADGNSTLDMQFKQVMQILLHSGMMILYTFSLMVLFVTLFARGIYLWIFIAISPIAVLIKVMGKHNKSLAAPTDDVFWDVEKAIKLIFYPVYYALFIGLMMIVLVVLNRAFKFNLSSGNSPLLIDKTATATTMNMEDNLLSVTMQNTTMGIYDLLLWVIGLAMMRMLVKTAIQQQTGIKAIDTFTKDMASTAQSMIETAPIIPVPWSSVGIGTLIRDDNVIDRSYQKQIQPLIERERSQMNAINQLFWFEEAGKKFADTDKRNLEIIVQKSKTNLASDSILKEYQQELQSIRKAGKDILFSDLEPTLFQLFSSKFKEAWRAYNLDQIPALENEKDDAAKRTVLMNYLGQNANFQKLYDKFFGVKDKYPRSGQELASSPELYKLPSIK